MSQSKVDKKRYERKHREEILRKQRRKKIAAITITIVVIVAVVGSIAGVKIYQAIPKYVSASELSDYVGEVWDDNSYGSLFTATSTDAEESDDTTEADESETDTTETDTSEDETTADDTSEE